ncbi:HEAT repeat-containing protein 5B [Trichinella spiralis]|uniref:HEAT repeat-containing protein 5B n=1 Tax=Trichinella spiralis TaxID=6334 RepID=A0A0V1BER6_TRISP|nr:HEAT repeat-containing protein 5B [Trichinella spiralis]
MELSNSLLLNESALNQLSKPKRAVFIHEWLRYLDQILPVAEKSDIKDCQKNLLSQMSSLINSGLGPPSRHLMARCLATLFSVGDAFYLYEAVNVCNDILKVKDDSPNYLPSKLTAICCIGAMYKSLGRMVGRSFEETTQILIRSLKNAESQSRAEIMNTLACLVSGLESGGSSVHKEIYKVAKSMLLDRQMAVRCAASKCIQALVLEAQFVWTHELETLCSTCFKAFDGCTHAVRRSIAKLLGLVLATAHNPPSNAKRLAAGVHHGVGMQPPSVKPISIEDVWAILSSGFLRGGMGFLKTSTNFHSGVSKEVRAGTAMVSRCCLFHYLLFFISSNVTTLQAYVEFFTCLGSSWLEKSLAKCVRHFFDLVTSGCQGSAGHGEAVFIRQCAVFALSNPLSKLFSEKMQMIACKEMGQIIAEHMNSFGILEPIFSVLLHPSELCRIAAAWCLRCISITVPSLMTPLLERCLLRLEHNKNSANAISGYSCATAALTAAVCHCPLGIPNSKCKASPLMVKSQLARLLSALKSVFPRTKKEAEQELSRGDFYTWQVTLTSRAGSMVCYFTILLREVVSEFTVVEGSNVNCTSLLHDFCCNEEAILFDLSFLLCDYRQIEELNLADGKLSLEKSGNLLDTVLNLVTSLLPCPSVVLRYAAAEAFGRLAQVAPEPQFIAEMVQVSYDKYVVQLSSVTLFICLFCNRLKLCRDANTRTGHSLALGCLHRYVGGLASGHQLDVSVSVLLALAQDTSSQLVQVMMFYFCSLVWALYSLRLIADSGGPMYRSFVEPTLNVCLNLLLSSSSFTANDVDNVGSVVRIRSNFLVISAIMSAHPDPFVQAQSIGCYQQLYLFAPLHVDLSLLVRRLCSLFTSCHLILRRAAFCCLRQLVQREARQVHQHVQALIPEGLNAAKVRIKGSASATDIASYLSAPSIQDSVLPETGIEGALFAALDDEDDPSAVSDLKEILLNLVQSLGSENLAHWLELCKDVVASADCNQSKEVPVAQDEQQEDDAWHVAESSREQERSSRWPSRVFAVQLVQKLITACEGERAHFDLALAKELQMNGRKKCYIEICRRARARIFRPFHFGAIPSAGNDFHRKTKTYVYMCMSALVFQVCSSWISSGVAKDVNNLRRVHQLLVAPLSKLKTESISVHLYNESCTALEKLSVLKAWAEVYIVAMNQELGRTDRGASLCSTGQPDVCYSDVLLQLVEPELNMLVEYWLAVLRDYALLSLPAEFHSQLPAEGICFTLETADLVRPYYKSVWATVLLAASIWLSGNNFELSTVEPADEGTRLNVLKDYTKTEWFHILLGTVEASVLSIVKRISIEALCSPKNFDPLHIRFCLASIKVMLANEWAQLQLLAGAKLAVDLLNVMHRLVLTRENVQLQSLCADIVVLVLDAAGRCCDSMQSGAKSDFLPISTERFVVLLSGRLTLLPIQLYLLTNTVRETSNLHNEPLVHGGGPGSSTGGDFCPKQPAAAALQSIRCLLKKPVLLQDGATSEPDPRWTLASTFACKDRSVSSEFIQALAPTVVDKVRSYLVSDNCGEAVTLPGGFQDACSSRVLVESLKALENLIHAAQETQQRLPLLALVVHFLLALTAVEDNVRGSKVRRQLYDFAMERMNSIGSLYTTEFKALLGQLPSLKARVEKALRSAYSTTAAPTAAAAEQRFSLNFKNKQQQQPLDQQSASPSDLLNQQQSSATAANKQTQADQPSITLTMDFSVSVRQDEFLPCLSSELQVAEGIHFQNSDHQVLFESVPAVVGTLAGQDPAQAGQGAVECRADEADIPADDGRQLFGQAGAELRPSGDGLDAGEVFEKFVPRRPTARVGQKRDQLVENVILAEAVAPDRDAGPAVRLLQILAHLFQVGFVERKYRRVNVGQFQPFANFQIELFEIFVNFAFVLLSADIFRVKFQI